MLWFDRLRVFGKDRRRLIRWTITEHDGLICQACLGRSKRLPDGIADDGSLVELVDPDERQAGWLVRLFLDERPVICERCTEGLEADEWLERRIEGHGDERDERRVAIQYVHEMISKYKRDSCMGDADEHAPGYLGSHEDYEPHEPFLKVEWAFLDLIPIWLNLEMLRLNPGRTFGDSEPPVGENLHLRQQNELMAEYEQKLARLCHLYRQHEKDLAPPPPADGG